MRLLEVYLAGSLVVTTMLVMVTVGMRKSHGMGSGSVVALALSAGLAWPLLAVAVVQVACFVTLAKGFRAIGLRNGPVLNPDEDSLSEAADDETVPVAVSAPEGHAPVQLISKSRRSRNALAGAEPLQRAAI